MSHHQHHTFGSSLPHHRLVVYRKALELLAAVRAAQITDAKLRDEALRAAKGTGALDLTLNAGTRTRRELEPSPSCLWLALPASVFLLLASPSGSTST